MCVLCDNTSAINLSKNPIQKSKHIEIRYHFIWDLVAEKIMCLEFINTDNQKADIFTKPLDGPRFESLRKTIGVGIIPWTLSLMWPHFVHFCILALEVSHVQLVDVMFLLQVLFCTCFCWSYFSCPVFECVQNSKTHKNWKIFKKIDRLCYVYHMWVWPSTFVLMA